MMEPGNKYLVIEAEDVEANLTTGEYLLFHDLIRKIALGREDAGKKVVEHYAVMEHGASYCPEMLKSMQQENG